MRCGRILWCILEFTSGLNQVMSAAGSQFRKEGFNLERKIWVEQYATLTPDTQITAAGREGTICMLIPT